MYVNCQGALAIKIWPGIFILKNCEVHQNQKNGTKQPNGYILSAYVVTATTADVMHTYAAVNNSGLEHFILNTNRTLCSDYTKYGE